MNNHFEAVLEARVVESFNLTDAVASDLAGESVDNISPTVVLTPAIITSAVEC